ncbi:transposase [Paraburkholderia xenovorans]|uniref:DUF6566 family protein n=1 Tax=Paraburkholderia xenovorans TaxID=36873 RepID=UPI0038B77490
MFFDELSNDEWALLAALVSDEPAVRLNRRGRPRAEPRIVANAVLWIMTTGEPWSKLPGRYPSGPTCRRRFEEWQMNGTLLDMVRLLSGTGRTFAYVPQPAPPVTAKPAAPVAPTPSVREEFVRGVSWKSPESWQAPGASSRLSSWRSADPIADITRQLSGLANVPPPVSRTPAPRPSMRAPMTDMRPDMSEAGAVGVAMYELNAAIASARYSQDQSEMQGQHSRSALSMSLAPRGTQIADQHGYAIYVAAERVPNAMYRAWAEIMKDGKRVERSGLVGPRFAQADEAEQYALEWAQQWIDRECLTLAAGSAHQQAAHASHPQAAGAVQATTQATAQATTPPVARPLPAMRHVPEPVVVNHSGPLHGPINAFRGPLRRYPSEPAAPGNTASESSASDRYPSYPELISHAG